MKAMNRREFLGNMGRLAAGSMATAYLSNLSPAFTAPGTEKLNFVFLLMDDLGWKDIGCYGSSFYDTPNIDRLASQGMRFTNAYAACPVCSPTRASIMTGKYPARLHLTDWIPGYKHPDPKLICPEHLKQLPLEEITIAEALKPAGYTSASIGKWHMGHKDFQPDKQGFDVAIGATYSGGSPPTYFFPYKIPTLQEGQEGEYLTDRLAKEAVKFIEKNKDRPFFLYLPQYAVHVPHQAKKELIEKYKTKAPGQGQSDPTYAAMIYSMDEAVGQVMAKLDELKLTEKTVVVFMGDNGGLARVTSNAPLRAGKGNLYEGGIREPMIIRWPGVVKPGSTCDVPVTSTDFYRTILEMADTNVPESCAPDGKSLVPLLKGSDKPLHDSIFWHYPHYNNLGGEPGSAVRQGDYKLIEFFEGNRIELYNLKNDIGEQENLAERMPKTAERLKKTLADWRKSVDAQMPVPK